MSGYFKQKLHDALYDLVSDGDIDKRLTYDLSGSTARERRSARVFSTVSDLEREIIKDSSNPSSRVGAKSRTWRVLNQRFRLKGLHYEE